LAAPVELRRGALPLFVDARKREAADPAAFVSEEPDWNVGDTFVAGGRSFRILDISDREIAEVSAHTFEAVWTVEEVRGWRNHTVGVRRSPRCRS
jgi:hypothetical protein